MNKKSYSIAVVGATGLVGAEVIAVLAERQFPIAALQLYASLRTAGDEVECGPVKARVDLLERARFTGTDIVFLAAGEQITAAWAERATDAGAVVIDTSQVFADDPEVPLIVPEVNAADLAAYGGRGLVASPDAAATALAVALHPLHDAVRITRVVATTFEPVSSAGRAGIEELQRETVELLNGRSVEPEVFPQRIAFNTLPQIGEFLEGGATRAERQTATALQRLLRDPDVVVSITRVQVPLFFGEGISVNLETNDKLNAAEAREILRAAPGVLLQEDPSSAVDTVGQDTTCVARVRGAETANVLDLWIAFDNIRKGAAVNAIQIAELLIRDYL